MIQIRARAHHVQQVHRAFRCLDRLKFICHAQRDSPLTMIRVYVYHYTLPVVIGHSSNSRNCDTNTASFAQQQAHLAGPILSELANVNGAR